MPNVQHRFGAMRPHWSLGLGYWSFDEFRSFLEHWTLRYRPFAKMNSRILIIEDELPMRTALKDVLQAEGYRVLTAADGAAGLERALAEKPDLLLLDLMMPKLDG